MYRRVPASPKTCRRCAHRRCVRIRGLVGGLGGLTDRCSGGASPSSPHGPRVVERAHEESRVTSSPEIRVDGQSAMGGRCPVTKQPGTRVDVVSYGDVAMAVVAPDLRPLRAHWPALRPIPSFVAGSWLVVASVERDVIGCARVEPTPVPFPPARALAAPGLGLDRCDEWLAGGMEMVELIVHPQARGYGVGSLLEATARSASRDHRAWVSLAGEERAALPFFRRREWTPVTDAHGRPTDPVLLLAPRHPAVATRASSRRTGRLADGTID